MSLRDGFAWHVNVATLRCIRDGFFDLVLTFRSTLSYNDVAGRPTYERTEPLMRQPTTPRASRHLDSVTSRSGAIGAFAIGALAVGALAIGALAIGRLAIGRARIRSLTIDELTIKRITPESDSGVSATRRKM